MTKLWHEDAAEWLAKARGVAGDPLADWLRAALAERAELIEERVAWSKDHSKLTAECNAALTKLTKVESQRNGELAAHRAICEKLTAAERELSIAEAANAHMFDAGEAEAAAAERAAVVAWLRTGWRSAKDDYEPDLCPNCVTPWKCNYPHLDYETAHELAHAVESGAHIRPGTGGGDGEP